MPHVGSSPNLDSRANEGGVAEIEALAMRRNCKSDPDIARDVSDDVSNATVEFEMAGLDEDSGTGMNQQFGQSRTGYMPMPMPVWTRAPARAMMSRLWLMMRPRKRLVQRSRRKVTRRLQSRSRPMSKKRKTE